MYQAIIVDDEKWVIKSLIATLGDQKYFEIVGEFYTGTSAYSYIREFKPDLAFIDVQITGMNGLEILQAAKEEGLPTLFIVISGHAEFAYVQKALFHNAISYCLKPFSRNELMDSMQKAYQIVEERKPAAVLAPPQAVSEKQERLQVENKTVQTMVDYILEHFSEDISIQLLADLAGITPNYASQLFKEETGSTFSNYLTQIRIQKACELLKDTDMAIFMVAGQVGYKDYFYFAKVFKKITGHTPSTYRSAYRSGSEESAHEEKN